MVKQKLPKVFHRDELVKLFDSIENPIVAVACLLTLVTGMRIGEVISLKWKDCNVDSLKIRIVDAKTGHGFCDLPDDNLLITTLKRWKYLTGHQEYFIPYENTNYEARLSWLLKAYKKEIKRAGLYSIEKRQSNGNKMQRLNYHTLRHTFASLGLEKTGDIYYVQKAMRHNSVKTTEIYLHISDPVRKERTNQAWSTRPRNRTATPMSLPTAEPPKISPMEVLQLKLVNGEISKKEYLEKLALLDPTRSILDNPEVPAP